jgi:hypothetical protein
MAAGMVASMNSVYYGKNKSIGQPDKTFTGPTYYLLHEQSVPSFLG